MRQSHKGDGGDGSILKSGAHFNDYFWESNLYNNIFQLINLTYPKTGFWITDSVLVVPDLVANQAFEPAKKESSWLVGAGWC